jgi:hypothetical protein
MLKLVMFAFIFICSYAHSLHKKVDQKIQIFRESDLLAGIRLENFTQDPNAKIVSIEDPHDSKPIPFKAVVLRNFLEQQFGSGWAKQFPFIEFRAADGYQAIVSSSDILSFNPYLAFARADQNDFSFTDKFQKDKKQELGPLYLVWDIRSHPELRGRSTQDWPYAVVSIVGQKKRADIPQLVEKFKKHPEGQKGYEIFRDRCFSCHSLNPVKSPSMHTVISLVKSYNSENLRKRLSQSGTAMPPQVVSKEESKALKIFADLF